MTVNHPFLRTDGSFDDALLSTWLADQCGQADQRAIDRWSEADPANAAWLATLRNGYHAAGRPLIQGNLPAALTRLRMATTNSPSTQRRVSPPRGYTRSSSRFFISRFAVVLGVVLLTAISYLAYMRWEISASPNVVHEYATARGERATLRLPDGSTVVLAPASRVRYSHDFGQETREVTLVGAALFTVTHGEKAPFVVHTAGTATRVLGTVFSVRRYDTDTEVQVVVAEGKVAFGRTGSSSIVLATGDLARLNDLRLLTVSHHSDLATALAWVDDKLNFDHVLLRDALPDIERQYDIEFNIQDTSLTNQQITASFNTKSADEMLETLGCLLDAHVKRSGRVVTMTPTYGKRTSAPGFTPSTAPNRTRPIDDHAPPRTLTRTLAANVLSHQ